MSKIVSLVAVAMVAFVFGFGCAADPNENETDVENGGSGGQAGAPAVVGGAGGCSEGGSGGQVGQAGAGGTTQVAPFKFDCTDVTDGHFVVKAKLAEPIPPGYFAIDGSKIYPKDSGYQNLPWGNIFIAEDDGLANVVWDDGKVPTDSRYELNFGMSLDGKTLFKTQAGEEVAIDPNKGPWFYFPESIYCFGNKELGGYQNGGTQGKLAVSQDGHRVLVFTE